MSEIPERVVAGEAQPWEEAEERHIRPRTLAEYVGQKQLRENLSVFIRAARARQEPLDHCLFVGPPGLGKTTLAHIIAREMGVELHATSGPAVEHKGDLAGLLTKLAPGDVLFIDEIHRLNPAVEEALYPAMEDFSFDFVVGEGPGAKALKLDLQPFTLVGATTRTGLLTSPLRDRFGIHSRLEFYSPAELELILKRAAQILDVALAADGGGEISRRSRGTPRIALRLLRRVRDFAQVAGEKKVTRQAAADALLRLNVDARGLDPLDQLLLKTLVEKFGGGPVGVETLAASVAEEKNTIEEVVEPFLLQEGFLLRTPRGRVAAALAYEHLGKLVPPGVQKQLL